MKNVCVPAERILTKNRMKDFQICVHPHLVVQSRQLQQLQLCNSDMYRTRDLLDAREIGRLDRDLIYGRSTTAQAVLMGISQR